MTTNTRPVYKRILPKLSGETPQGTEGFGIDTGILDRMVQEIKELVELGIQVGVVISGGNLFRDAGLAKVGVDRVVGGHVGIPATVMNGLAMRDALHHAYVSARLMSVIPLSGMYDSYNQVETIGLLCNNCVAIFSTGASNPFFTTDSAACLRSVEIGADVVLRIAKVNDMFTTDPAKDPTVTMCEQLTYNEVLEKELKVMDLVIFTLARDHGLPIRVFNMDRPGTLRRVVMDKREGTLITE